MTNPTEFDRWSRHVIAAALIRSAVEPPGPILEIGGSQGFTRILLPNYDITVTDIAGSDVNTIASAEDLPFVAGEFSAVLMLDVLEHVPTSQRTQIIHELARVVRSCAVIGGPFVNSEIVAAEQNVRDLYRRISGRDHRWLSEHLDFGLPDLGAVHAALGAVGFDCADIPTNPIPMWKRLQLLNFAAAASDHADLARGLHEQLAARFLGGGDQKGSPYRRVILALKDGDPQTAVTRVQKSLGSSGTKWGIKDANSEIDRALADVIRATVLDTQRQQRYIEGKNAESAALHDHIRSSRSELDRETRAAEKLRRDIDAERAARRLAEDRTSEAEAKAAEAEGLERAFAIRIGSLGDDISSRRAEATTLAKTAARVKSDVKRFKRSRTWRIGNAIGTTASALGRSDSTARGAQRLLTEADELANKAAAADSALNRAMGSQRHISMLARNAKTWDKPTAAELSNRLDQLEAEVGEMASEFHTADAAIQQVGATAAQIERSRRWRIGLVATKPIRVLRRRSPEPALTRIQRLAATYTASTQHQRVESSAGSMPFRSSSPVGSPAQAARTGFSFDEDKTARDTAYANYVERIEPGLLTAAQREADSPFIHVIVNVDERLVEEGRLLFDVQRTVSAAIELESITVVGLKETALHSLRASKLVRIAGPGESLESVLHGMVDDTTTFGEDSLVLVLAPGDLVRPELSNHLVSVSAQGTSRAAGAVIFDHDRISASGKRSDPQFKPEFSPDWLIEFDYIGSAVAFSVAAVNELDLADLDTNRVQRDLLFRLHAQGSIIRNIPLVLMHRAAHLDGLGTDDVSVAENRFVERTLERLNADAKFTVERRHSGIRVRYRPTETPLVSIIIPFRDKPDLLRTAVSSIRRLTDYDNYEILLVDNDSESEETSTLIEELQADDRVRVLEFPGPFNYSRANNTAAVDANGDVLVFLNNDTRVLSTDWLDRMVGHAIRPEIGAVGAMLHYADGSLQHAGVVVGMKGFAAHLFAGEHPPFVPQSWLNHARNTSAVTAACLAVERKKYDAVGGLDEEFILTGNDVDFCLRLLKSGYRNIVEPDARLIHYEKRTRSPLPVPENDQVLSFHRYQPFLTTGDPYFNPNWSRWNANPVPRVESESGISQLRESVFGPRTESTPIDGFLQRYDASEEDLSANASAVNRERVSHGTGRLDSITWFVPFFTHIYRGGIYTIMRFADYFSRQSGTLNRVVICDRPQADLDAIRTQIQSVFPEMQFELYRSDSVEQAADLPPSDVGICTLWTTAYHLLRFNQCDAKYYFVQDFEPSFTAADAQYGLVEQTYRFGFRGIANTPGVGDAYRSYGNEAVDFIPAVDTSVFYADPNRDDDGSVRIMFYGRPANHRNGFELGVQALTEVKTRYGDGVEIVSAGAAFEEGRYGLESVLTNLGVLPNLDGVADEYRKSHIGLVFMYSKHPSYQPLEYMASGCATVTNINEANTWLYGGRRNSLQVAPTVSAVADALGRLIEDSNLRSSIVESGFATVRGKGWDEELARVHAYMTGAVDDQ